MTLEYGVCIDIESRERAMAMAMAMATSVPSCYEE
jgi:hypothetical protein